MSIKRSQSLKEAIQYVGRLVESKVYADRFEDRRAWDILSKKIEELERIRVGQAREKELSDEIQTLKETLETLVQTFRRQGNIEDLSKEKQEAAE